MEKHFFNKDLFRKVFYFEWALLIICSAMEFLSWQYGPKDVTAPDLRVSLILLGMVGALSVMAPVKGSYWDRFCFLLLELMLITGSTAAGLARFLFPLFVVVVAKACLLLDRRGMLAILISAIIASLTYAVFKLALMAQVEPRYASLFAGHLSPYSFMALVGTAIVFVYVAIMLMVLVAILTLALQGEAVARREAERLSKEVQQLATELERGRIAREIHDSLGHTLTSLNIQLEVARKFATREPDRAGAALDLAKELASQSLTDVRMAIQSIRTGSDFDFRQAVNRLVDHMKQTQNGMDVELDMNIEAVPPSVGYQVFRVIQECLTNAMRHAEASRIRIALAQSGDELNLQVSDNGRGLPETRLNSGFGIRGIRERIESIHGTVAINAAPNQGTNIEVQIPLKVADVSTEAAG